MLHIPAIAGCRCRSRRAKPQHQAEYLHPASLILLAMVCAGLCWLRSASTEASPKRFRVATPSAFPNHTVGDRDGKKLKTVLGAALSPTLSYSAVVWERWGGGSCQQLSRQLFVSLPSGQHPTLSGHYKAHVILAEASCKTGPGLVAAWTITCRYRGQGASGTWSLWEVWSLANPLC